MGRPLLDSRVFARSLPSGLSDPHPESDSVEHHLSQTPPYLAVGAYVSCFLSPKQIMQNHMKSWQIMQNHAPENA